MAGNKRKNKARNQTTGNVRGRDDATWFKNNKQRQRGRSKMAKASRRANRGN